MANTVIWYTAVGAVRPTRIDFGRRLTARSGPSLEYRQAVEESVGGIQSTTLYGGRSRVSIQHTWTRDGSGDGDRLRRRLFGLVSHLQRGGNCMVVEDGLYAFAAFCTRAPVNGDTTLGIGDNVFENLGNATTLNQREVVVFTDPDTYIAEMKLCSSAGLLGDLTFSEKFAADFSIARWTMLRELGSYPFMRIPRDLREAGDFLTQEHEWLFTLDLPLEDDVAALEAQWLSTGATIGDDESGTGVEWGQTPSGEIGQGGPLTGGPLGNVTIGGPRGGLGGW